MSLFSFFTGVVFIAWNTELDLVLLAVLALEARSSLNLEGLLLFLIIELILPTLMRLCLLRLEETMFDKTSCFEGEHTLLTYLVVKFVLL